MTFCKEKKMGLFRKAIQDKFVIVAISSGLTMDADNDALMVSAIKRSKPSYWEMRNPDGYAVFFWSKESDGRKRGEMLLSQVQDLISRSERFAEFKVGLSEGKLVTEVNWRGRVCLTPMGEPVNDAFKNQEGKTGMQNHTPEPIGANRASGSA